MFLPGYCLFNVSEVLEVDQRFHIVSLCEAFYPFLFMLLHPPPEVIRDTSVEDGVVAVGEDIGRIVVLVHDCRGFVAGGLLHYRSQ